jgi:hypothetical protein
MIDFFMYLTYAMLVIATLLALGFAFWFVFKNLKNAKGTIWGTVGLIVLFFISYALSSNEVYEKFHIVASYSKFIGGTLIMLYLVFLGTILSAIYVEIAKLFK